MFHWAHREEKSTVAERNPMFLDRNHKTDHFIQPEMSDKQINDS
jgi:hypothetical protein